MHRSILSLLMYKLQWNVPKVDSIGTEKSVLIREVSYLGKDVLSLIERCCLYLRRVL